MNDNHEEMERVLEETKEYYRHRSSQYSDWSRRTGKYEGGSEPDESYFNEARMLLDALDSNKLTGDVLEIASGTGIWTEALTRHATSITALDSSQEMIEQCKTRLRGNPKVRHVHADFYTWIPDRQYDAVTFSFWISHVPSWKLDEFAMKVSNYLRPRGRIFFVDQQRSAMKHELLDSLAEKSHPGPSKTEKRSTSSNTSTRLRKSPNPYSITGSRQESRTRPTTSTT